MLQGLWEICTSYGGSFWLTVASDLAIALAYFAIPLTMAVVLRDRKDDIPYPWLWSLFVVFIIACGLTHVVHVWSAVGGGENVATRVVIGLITAVASVSTAIAFAAILPQIKDIPSPRRRQAELEATVAARTAEKDRLIREINHRVGNQLQIISSLVRIEQRQTASPETLGVLSRLQVELDNLNARHHEHSGEDFLVSDGRATVEQRSWAATPLGGALTGT